MGGTTLIYEEINERTDIVPQRPIPNPYLERVRIGSSLIESETLNVIPIVVSTENIEGACGKNTIFCDTPGFNDTRGSEIDISNGIAIRKCVELCTGLKPVIIICNQLGAKLQFLKDELANVLNSMFLKFEDDIRDFVYVYTKFKNEKEIKDILKSAENSLNEAIENNEETSKAFEIMIKDMKKKAFRGPLIIIDPINGDREEALSKIFLSTEFMKRLSDRISYSLSSKSQDKLERQVEKHFKSIEKSIEIFDYNLAIYKLDQLSTLKDILRKKEINESFDAIIKKVFENFQKQFRKKNDEFRNKIQNNVLFTDDVINDLMMFIKNIKSSDKLLKYIDSDSIDLIENKFEFLKRNLCDTFNEHLSNLVKKGLYIEADKIAITLDNLKNVLEKYEDQKIDNEVNSDFDKVYEANKILISKDIRALTDETKAKLTKNVNFGDSHFISESISNDDSIKENEFEFYFQYFNDVSNNLKMLRHLNETLKNHFDENSLCYNELKSFIRDIMLKTGNKFDYVLKKSNEEDIIHNIDVMKSLLRDLSDTYSYFKSALNCISLQEHIQLNLIEDCQKSFTTNLKNYFESLLNIANELIRHLEENPLISNESLYPSDKSFISKYI